MDVFLRQKAPARGLESSPRPDRQRAGPMTLNAMNVQAQQKTQQKLDQGAALISLGLKVFQPSPKSCPLPLTAEQLPPVKQVEKKDAKKAEAAAQLAAWLETTMRAQGATVAVVARGGTWQVRTQDQTGMEHAGILVLDDPHSDGQPMIYDLMPNDCSIQRFQSRPMRADLGRIRPEDFFYLNPDRRQYDNGLLLIPDPALQHSLRAWMGNRKFHRTYVSQDYNLVTTYDTERSLNCNKWVLMNVMGAYLETLPAPESPDAAGARPILNAIRAQFQPADIKAPPLLRAFATHHPTILSEEVSCFGPIRTVSVESLYHSGLFAERHFAKPHIVLPPTGPAATPPALPRHPMKTRKKAG